MTTIPATAIMLDGSTIAGALSNEHAASSYGQFVFVTADGQAIDSWQLTNITPDTATSASVMGSRTSQAKADAARANGRKGGRPKKS